MIVSKESTHSPGGYSYQEQRLTTQKAKGNNKCLAEYEQGAKYI
jgi:hypothetical protein